MIKKKTLSILPPIFILLLLGSCSGNWQTFQEGTYNGESYQLQYRETRGFTTNGIDHRFRLGNRKYIYVDATTTVWGPPYSTDIYSGERYTRLSVADTTYQNLAEPLPGGNTFLYLSKSRFTPEEYEEYTAFMRREWIKIDQEIHRDSYDHFPHIIGTVYGSPEDFVREFRGRYMDQDVKLVIENDGRISITGEGTEIGHNLSPKVQMPGKRILVDTTAGNIDIDLLKTFRDKQGIDPTKVFEFVTVKAVPSSKGI